MEDNKPQNSDHQKTLDDQMIQRVIDPITGRDITEDYITARLKELEHLADDLIKKALDAVMKHPFVILIYSFLFKSI